MTRTTGRCRFTEGSITLPQGYQDKTVNIFTSTKHDAPGISISRDILKADQTLTDYVSQQLEQLQKQMKKWEQGSRQTIAATDTLPEGERVCASYSSLNDQRIWQIQAIFVLQHNRILVFTLTRTSPPQPEDHQLITDLLAGFTLPAQSQ